MTAIDYIGRSGDQRIDGQLEGTRWAGSKVTYSFPDARSDYGYSEPGISALRPGQASAVRNILEGDSFSVEALTRLDLTFIPGGSGAGTIRQANGSGPSTAYTYLPSTDERGGDSFYGPSGSSPVVGNYHFHTVLHETGHALGLKHGHDSDVFGAIPRATDSMEYSVMTYRSYVGSDAEYLYNASNGFAQSFMAYDIAALQYLYGADFTTNAGNTTYSWRPTSGATLIDGETAISPGWNRIFATIWDGGGIDTYDLSRYKGGLDIDLAPGGCSTFSAAQCADLGGGPNGGLARGNIFNALQYRHDPRSLIENAIGGQGNDSIAGNSAANELRGGAGKDLLSGRAGADTLHDGAGNDELAGGSGADRLLGGVGDDLFRFALGDSTPSARDVIAAGDGAGAFQGAGQAGGDRIDLSGIDADVGKAGDQAFVLGGTGKGHLAITAAGGDSLVRGNIDGDAPFEVEFRIADAGVAASAYNAMDFIL